MAVSSSSLGSDRFLSIVRSNATPHAARRTPHATRRVARPRGRQALSIRLEMGNVKVMRYMPITSQPTILSVERELCPLTGWEWSAPPNPKLNPKLNPKPKPEPKPQPQQCEWWQS